MLSKSFAEKNHLTTGSRLYLGSAEGTKAFVVRGIIPLAMVYQERAEYDQAEHLYRQALRIRLQVFGANDPTVADSYADLARLFVAERKFDLAAEFATNVTELRSKLFGPDDQRLCSQ